MKMSLQAIAAITAFCFGTAASPQAHAIGCPIWMCGTNGTQLNGILPHGLKLEGIQLQDTDILLPEVEKAKEARVLEQTAPRSDGTGKPQAPGKPGAE